MNVARLDHWNTFPRILLCNCGKEAATFRIRVNSNDPGTAIIRVTCSECAFGAERRVPIVLGGDSEHEVLNIVRSILPKQDALICPCHPYSKYNMKEVWA